MTKKKLWHEKDEFEGAAKMSNGLLRRTGAFARHVPPNVVTIAGGLLALPMLWAYLGGHILLGTILFTVSQLTDWIDGALARYQQREAAAGRLDLRMERGELTRLGPTEYGKKLDPVIDKFRYFAALFPLGWPTLPHGLVWCALGIAIALTVLREGVRLLWGLKPGANAYGKYKVWAEITVIAALVFLPLLSALEIPASSVFVAATALGGVSLFTQGWSIRRQLLALEEELGLSGLSFLEKARRIRTHLKNRKP